MSMTRLIIAYSALAVLSGPLRVFAQTPQAPAPGAAGTPSSPATLQSEAGEPRAMTSPDAPSPAAAGSAPAAARAPSAGAAEEAAGAGSGARGATSRVQRAGQPAAPVKAATDRLELGTATVTGDREQPKVMYIVPWKRSDIGDLSGKPMNSLLDEALAPVDRDEFKRQVVYYQAVKADASQNGAKPPAQQGEK
ncbi:MAG: hypothetical protein ABSG29_02250 [Steroidobacteraceae bacterium]|jgi:hypothetical protein